MSSKNNTVKLDLVDEDEEEHEIGEFPMPERTSSPIRGTSIELKPDSLDSDGFDVISPG